ADRALEQLPTFDWIVFTSANGVRGFLGRLSARTLPRAKVAAIGAATARCLEAFGRPADLVPDDSRSEGLVEALRDRVLGKRLLLVGAEQGRRVLDEE